MHAWILSSTPAGHAVAEFGEAARTEEIRGVLTLIKGTKTFFFSGRIIAGQANLMENSLGFKDFKWLAKDEIQKQVSPWYWSKVQNMLRDR
jgi:large subunit ribosomal protein L46